ncbi:MAG: hypothetical protein ACM3U2_23290, partial [Deltaproteobacteria bacterium]
LYLKGWTQEAIARFFDVSQVTISRDLAETRREWREAATIDFEESLCSALQKLDLVEREAWGAWQRSQTPLTAAVRTEGSGNRGVTSRSSLRNSHGDPRFLDLVHKCVAQRSLLLGLTAAAPAAGEDVHEHEPIEVRRERLLTAMARLGFAAGAGGAGAGPDGAEPGGVRPDGECGEVGAGAAPDAPRPGADGGA